MHPEQTGLPPSLAIEERAPYRGGFSLPMRRPSELASGAENEHEECLPLVKKSLGMRCRLQVNELTPPYRRCLPRRS